MSNPNICDNCDHKKQNDNPELHCYMFKDEPTDICMQHTLRRTQPTFDIWRAIAAEVSKYKDS